MSGSDLMTGASEVVQSPDGWVAQRFPEAFTEGRYWLLTYRGTDGNLTVQALSDDEVADWPRLTKQAES
jgi:hypothetical protein